MRSSVRGMFTNTRTQSMRRLGVALLAAAGLTLGGCAADGDVDAPTDEVEIPEDDGMDEDMGTEE